MFKKIAAVTAIAFIALFAAPAAAYADYVPESNIVVSGDTSPGGTVTVTFADGSFDANEPVDATVTGDPEPTWAALNVYAGTIVTNGTASSTGSIEFSFVLPSDAAGAYTLTATGLQSGNVGSATISVTPADSGTGGPGGLVNTGSALPALLIWGAVGALLLGTASLAVITVSRRNKVSA